ncbi:MAG: hypothetical protein JW755_03160 [Candidatus Aminicenantes bacterium]|nr:hypothetical protein [Candidatus Aminicenantes bacterium]
MNDIRIKNVLSKSDLKKFIHFPWKIYKDDPNWVPPLIMDMKEKLNRKKNPFFEHAKMDLFLAFRENELAGRIAAIIDFKHNDFHSEKVVFFGLYESINDSDVTESLLNTVAKWGKEQGMETLRGPVNLSLNDECAFLLEGFDSPPVIMMPYNPPYYLELMEKYGMVKAKDLYAFFMRTDQKVPDNIQSVLETARKKSTVTLRTADMKHLDKEADKIKYVYNHGWERNWGFVPWTEKEMDHMVHKLKLMADPDIVILAEDKDKPVGFAFGLPNYNEVLKKMNGRLFPFGFFTFLKGKKKIKGVRTPVFGILKEYRLTGLSYLLCDELTRSAFNKGYEWGETSWQLEDNEAVNRLVMSLGAKLYKKYRIFEKRII